MWDAMDYTACALCPRACGVNRAAGELGVCRMPGRLQVAKVMRHEWEEPALAGPGGSGAIFFSGCTLGCLYCNLFSDGIFFSTTFSSFVYVESRSFAPFLYMSRLDISYRPIF